MTKILMTYMIDRPLTAVQIVTLVVEGLKEGIRRWADTILLFEPLIDQELKSTSQANHPAR